MKKVKNIKFLVLILTLALIISSFVLVAASAEEPATKPEIFAVNLAYEGDYHIAVAVDKATVKGGSVKLQVLDGAKDLGEFTPYAATQNVTINGVTKECYIIETPPIGQKDMGKVFTLKAIDAENNESAARTLSVAEYLYLRLFRDGIVEATEGKALAQKEFYFANLNAGAKAENLFYNFDQDDTNNIAVFVNEKIFSIIPGIGINLYDNATTTVTLPGSGYYTVTKYNAETYEKSTETLIAGSEITIDGHTVAKVSDFVPGMGEYYANNDIKGDRHDYSASNSNILLNGVSTGDTVGLVNNQLVLSRTDKIEAQSYLRWNYTAMASNIKQPKFVFETDFMFSGYKASVTSSTQLNLEGNGIEYVINPINDKSDETAIETINFGKFALKTNEWYNIRFEVDYTLGTVTYFVDGENCGSETLGTKDADGSSRVLWYYQRAQTAGTTTFDNTFIGWVDTFVIPDFVAGTGAYYTAGSLAVKNDGSNTDNFKHSNYQTNQAMSITSADGTVQVVSNGANSAGSASYVEWRTSNNIDTATQKYVFETDFKFDQFTASDASLGNLQFRIGSNSISIPSKAANTGEVTQITIGMMTLDAGEWYNIRFVVDFATGGVEYFVNGVSVGSETYSAVAGGNVVRFIWNFNTTSTYVDFKFDNLTYGTIAK